MGMVHFGEKDCNLEWNGKADLGTGILHFDMMGGYFAIYAISL